MERKAADILDRYRLMTLATLRADGWPQATMVNYANSGLLVHFIISRTSQKFANIVRDSRVSIAVGADVDDPAEICGLSIAANAAEVLDPAQRDHAIRLILDRHPGLAALGTADFSHCAVMRAWCSIVAILDYSKGLGHREVLTIGPDRTDRIECPEDDWGFLKATGKTLTPGLHL